MGCNLTLPPLGKFIVPKERKNILFLNFSQLIQIEAIAV